MSVTSGHPSQAAAFKVLAPDAGHRDAVCHVLRSYITLLFRT
jgi:hypothetical protein